MSRFPIVIYEVIAQVMATEPLQRIYTDLEGNCLLVGDSWCYAPADGATKQIYTSDFDGLTKTVLNTDYEVRYLQTDGQYLYYTDGAQLVRCSPDGSNAVVAKVAKAGERITEFVLKDGGVVYNLNGTNRVVKEMDSIVWENDASSSEVIPNSPTTTQPPTTEVKSEVSGGSDSTTETSTQSLVGETKVVAGNQYKITSTAQGSKTVSFSSTTKNVGKVIVPAKIEINGTTYKVTSIADNAFSGNKKLTSVTLPSGLTKIGKNAFKNCTNLKSVTIPKTVKEIGANAFCNCKKLSKITIKGTAITKIGKNAFKNISKKAVILVPKKKKAAYKKLLKNAGYTKTIR